MGLGTDLGKGSIPSMFTYSYCSEVSKGETIYLSPAAVSAASPGLGGGPTEYKDTAAAPQPYLVHPAKSPGVFPTEEVVGKNAC